MGLFENKCLDHFNDLYRSKKRFNVSQGGTACFSESQKIITSSGVVKISDIKPDDLVLSHNEKLNIDEFKKVISCLKQENIKPCFRIKLKNGEIIESTEDHLFYFGGRWIELKKIVDLYKSKNNKNYG